MMTATSGNSKTNDNPNRKILPNRNILSARRLTLLGSVALVGAALAFSAALVTWQRAIHREGQCRDFAPASSRVRPALRTWSRG